jgi:hypothetical protein
MSSRLEERETIALSSLHDISDYSTYIDQRISKLNNLYQSLTIARDKHPRRPLPHQQDVLRHPSLSRHPPPHALNALPLQTLEGRGKCRQSPDQMYRTDYLPRKDRYQPSDEKSQIYADLKSLTHSNFRNSLDASWTRFSKQEERRPANKRLEIYKQIKNDILGTFYVGGRTLSHHQRDAVNAKHSG